MSLRGPYSLGLYHQMIKGARISSGQIKHSILGSTRGSLIIFQDLSKRRGKYFPVQSVINFLNNWTGKTWKCTPISPMHITYRSHQIPILRRCASVTSSNRSETTGHQSIPSKYNNPQADLLRYMHLSVFSLITIN